MGRSWGVDVGTGSRVLAFAAAPVRGLALAVPAMLGPPLLVVLFVTGHMGLPSPAFFVEHARRLPALARWLAGRWGGVEIPAPYRPAPEPPKRDAEGWHRDGDDLYRSAFVPAYLARLRWIAGDPATTRDLWWMALNPVIGGPLALLSPGLLGGGLALAWLQRPATGGAAALLGIAVGPASLRWHARWSGVLLAPARANPATVLAPRVSAGLRVCVSVGLAFVAAALATVQLLAILVTLTRLWPDTVPAVRRFVSWRRAQMGAWTGARIAEPYRGEPPAPVPDHNGSYRTAWGDFGTVHRTRESAARARRWQWTVRDPASWRDLAWLALELPVAAVLLAGPAALIAGGAVVCWLWVWISLLLLAGARVPWSPDDLLPALVPALAGVPAPVAAVAAAALGFAVGPVVLRGHAALSRLLLGPTKAAVMTRRIGELATSRTRLSDAQAAELRRIERDLHDGAQTRWIAVGMTLAAAEDLITRDPQAAGDLVAKAKDLSVSALAELRELIRGIHPPVLADRGLADAVRTLALDAPLEAEVRVAVGGQAAAPIETALYFGVSELLANIAKHAQARKVLVDLRHTDGVLKATVTDDGRGGATARPGGGLHGIRRRLEGFDGVLTLVSPPGGPTIATLEIPCALSSPRTPSSSGKGSSTC
ncbi:sensor histidine kinase [Nonomuraea sp. NPDC050394]|uniref:sensor histidine kinase n=1 Tax=Nonomuraea sp. NPDC050394 TaxID=3364363 RepID=UPI00379703B6